MDRREADLHISEESEKKVSGYGQRDGDREKRVGIFELEGKDEQQRKTLKVQEWSRKKQRREGRALVQSMWRSRQVLEQKQTDFGAAEVNNREDWFSLLMRYLYFHLSPLTASVLVCNQGLKFSEKQAVKSFWNRNVHNSYAIRLWKVATQCLEAWNLKIWKVFAWLKLIFSFFSVNVDLKSGARTLEERLYTTIYMQSMVDSNSKLKLLVFVCCGIVFRLCSLCAEHMTERDAGKDLSRGSVPIADSVYSNEKCLWNCTKLRSFPEMF